MPDRASLEALLVANLELVARLAAATCRRHGVHGADAEEFAATVRLRLVEDDYAVLARFRQEASLPTYLAVVIAMLFRDWQVSRRGRWRPSAAALHAGPVAVKLERLVYRDAVPFAQAAQLLQLQEVPPPTLRELTAILRALPARGPMRPVEVGETPLAAAAAPRTADDAVLAAEDEALHRAALDALRRALEGLAPEDQVIVRLRFWEGASVADVARALGLPQKPLYRRLERLLVTLRAALAAAGFDGRALGEAVGRTAAVFPDHVADHMGERIADHVADRPAPGAPALRSLRGDRGGPSAEEQR